MAENDGQGVDSLGDRQQERSPASGNSAKSESLSLAEKRAFLEKLKESGFDSSFVFHEDNSD